MKYDPDGPPYANELISLDETTGFWILMNTADTLEVTGLPPVSSGIELKTGWNLEGFPSAVNGTLPGILSANGVGTDFIIVYAYHPEDTSDPWKIYDRNAPPYTNDLSALAPGWTYWIFVTADHTWTIPYNP